MERHQKFTSKHGYFSVPSGNPDGKGRTRIKQLGEETSLFIELIKGKWRSSWVINLSVNMRPHV